VSGRAYPDYCRENLFRPAGLEATGFTGDDGLPRQAVGYDGERPVRKAAGHPYGAYHWQYRGMGGVVTSASDLWRFLQALDAGKVLKPESRRLMETPGPGGYGLGWGVTTTKRGTRRVGHGGDVRGFHAQVQRFPDEGAAVLVLGNVEGVPLWTLAWNLEALLLGGEPPYPMPPETIPLPDASLEGLTGEYALDEENRVAVERAPGGLLLAAIGTRACALLRATEDDPALAGQVRLAEEVVAAVRRGDARAIEDRLLDGIPKGWPSILLSRIWPAHLERFGELQSTRVPGAAAVAPGRVSTLFELKHANGSARLQVILQGGRLNIFDLNGPRHLVAARYLPVAPATFLSFAWTDPQPPGARFEDGALVLGETRLERTG
jgi:hypothetical protein